MNGAAPERGRKMSTVTGRGNHDDGWQPTFLVVKQQVDKLVQNPLLGRARLALESIAVFCRIAHQHLSKLPAASIGVGRVEGPIGPAVHCLPIETFLQGIGDQP